MTRRTTALLIAIIVFSAALRFHSLGSKSLWLDEIASVQRVRGTFRQMLSEVVGSAETGGPQAEQRRQRSGDAHPPLYYVFQYAAKALGHSEAAARVPSALCGIALTGVVFLLGRRLFGERYGLAAAGMCAISEFQVFYSQEARHYELAALLAATSLWMLLELMDGVVGWWDGGVRGRRGEEGDGGKQGGVMGDRGKPMRSASSITSITSIPSIASMETRPAGEVPRRWALWAAYTLVGAAMLYTFYYLAFALLAEAAILLVSWRRTTPIIRKWLVSRIVVAVLFAPYLTVVLDRISGLPPVPQQSRLEVLQTLPAAYVQMLTGLEPAALQFSLPAAILVYAAVAIAILLPLVLMLIRADGSAGGEHRAGLGVAADSNVGADSRVGADLGVGADFRVFEESSALFRSRFLAIAAVLYVLIPALAVLLLPWRLQIFEAKHIAFVAPVLLVLAVWLPVRYRRPVAWLPVALVIIFNAYSLAVYCHPQCQKERWPDACAIVHRNVKPGDAILFNPDYLAYAFAYYYEYHGELARVENVSAIPPSGEPGRLWLIEERGSNVAPADPAVEPAILRGFEPGNIAHGGAERENEVMLNGCIGVVVVKLYERR